MTKPKGKLNLHMKIVVMMKKVREDNKYKNVTLVTTRLANPTDSTFVKVYPH